MSMINRGRASVLGSSLTANDLERTRTCHDLAGLTRALAPILPHRPRSLLDIGCGFGGLTAGVARYLGAEEVCGLDADHVVTDEARCKGIDVAVTRAGEAALPYPDARFDLVMSLGILDSQPAFDPLLREIYRVVAVGGHVLVASPNLGSWHNRVGLLLGYQPRDVEISQEILAGVPKRYEGEAPDLHLHIPTLRAMTALMDHHGFTQVEVVGGRPRMNRAARPLEALDALFTRRPALARRFYYVGTKRSR